MWKFIINAFIVPSVPLTEMEVNIPCSMNNINTISYLFLCVFFNQRRLKNLSISKRWDYRSKFLFLFLQYFILLKVFSQLIWLIKMSTFSRIVLCKHARVYTDIKTLMICHFVQKHLKFIAKILTASSVLLSGKVPKILCRIWNTS